MIAGFGFRIADCRVRLPFQSAIGNLQSAIPDS